MKKSIIAVCLLLAGVVGASTIHTWANGETLLTADLNAVFQHIHNTMVGGHGARLVNADVNASAAISSSKLAGYRLIPRTWVTVVDANKACAAAATACTVITGASSTVTGNGTNGQYVVTLGYTATNTSYGATATVNGSAQGMCFVNIISTTVANVFCVTDAGAALNTGFTLVVYDND